MIPFGEADSENMQIKAEVYLARLLEQIEAKLTKFMSTTNVAFSDIQNAITQLSSDFATDNAAVQQELAEVKQLLTDYLSAVNTGGTPNQQLLQAALTQLTALDSQVAKNTQDLTTQIAAVKTGDPNTAPVAPVTNPPTASAPPSNNPTPGTPQPPAGS